MTQRLLAICLHLVRLESAGLGKIVINHTNNSLKTSDESGPRDNLIPEICLFVLQGEKDKRQLIHENESIFMLTHSKVVIWFCTSKMVVLPAENFKNFFAR